MEEPRNCRAGELEQVHHLLADRHRGEEVEGPARGGLWRALLLRRENAGRIRTLWDGRSLTACAGYLVRDAWISGTVFSIACIEAAGVRPGGAGARIRVLEDLEDRAADESCDLVLAPSGEAIYTDLGYMPVGQFILLRTTAERLPDLFSLEVRSASPEDSLRLVQLQQESAVRFERNVDEWRIFFEEILRAGDRQILIASSRNQAVAFAVLQRIQSGWCVIEHGGGSVALTQLLRTALKPEETLEIICGRAERDLRLLLEDAEVELLPFPGSVKILDPVRFFDRLHPTLFERLGEDASNDLLVSPAPGQITFEWAGQVLEIPEDRLPVVVFSPHAGSEPEPISEGPLVEVLSRVFPLPLPWPGLGRW